MGESTTRYLAWLFLVLVVAWGFLLQSVTIDELRQTQEQVTAIVAHEVEQREALKTLLCGLYLSSEDQATVDETFAEFGMHCVPEGG